MTLGTSLFLIALGAILKFAVTWTVGGIDLRVAGVILMIIGVLGLFLGLILLYNSRQTIVHRTDRYVPPPPPDL